MKSVLKSDAESPFATSCFSRAIALLKHCKAGCKTDHRKKGLNTVLIAHADVSKGRPSSRQESSGCLHVARSGGVGARRRWDTCRGRRGHRDNWRCGGDSWRCGSGRRGCGGDRWCCGGVSRTSSHQAWGRAPGISTASEGRAVVVVARERKRRVWVAPARGT
jgi:hypothetical protein